MSLKEENKIIGKYLLKCFAGKPPKVQRYWDTPETTSVDLLSVPDPERNGVLLFGTISLFEKEFVIDGEVFPSRVELVGAAYDAFEHYPNILTTAAFCSIKDDFFCQPGSVLPNAVKMYYPNLEAKHLFFTAPFLWEDKLGTLHLDEQIQINWVLPIPITDSEYKYLEVNGDDALEDLFEKHQIDIFDLSRPSII